MDIKDLTFQEYLKIINPKDESHPDSAYQFNLDDLNRIWPANNYPVVQQQFTINHRLYQLREKRIDNWDAKYVAHDENDQIKRDTQGNIVFLCHAEIELLIPASKRYTFEHAVVDIESNQVVGVTSDEWGCLLTVVASEYQGQGIGAKLLDFHRSNQPSRHSGGFTTAGFNNLHRFYRNKILAALGQGYYSQAARDQKLSTSKINNILKSAGVLSVDNDLDAHINGLSRLPKEGIDLGFKSTSNLLLHADGATFILFDRNVLNIATDFCGGKYEHFISEGIKAFAYIGDTIFDNERNERLVLLRLYAQSQEMEIFIINSVLSSLAGQIDEIVVPAGLAAYDSFSGLNTSNTTGTEYITISVPENPAIQDLDALSAITSRYLKSIDPYGERFTLLHEFADKYVEEHSISRINNHKQLIRTAGVHLVPR